jgi:hypothetical protein
MQQSFGRVVHRVNQITESDRQDESSFKVRRNFSFERATGFTVMRVCIWDKVGFGTDRAVAQQAPPDPLFRIVGEGLKHLIEIVGKLNWNPVVVHFSASFSLFVFLELR